MNYEDSESLKIYFSQISRFELLTREDEIRLAKEVEKGKEGALEKLTNHNLRLVVQIAKHYQGKGLPLLDLVQEGNIGLKKAAKKYDYRKGVAFSTYSARWIRQSIGRAIHGESRNIKLPVHASTDLKRVVDAKYHLMSLSGHSPTISKLAEYTKLPEEAVKILLSREKDSISFDTASSFEDNPISYFLGDENENVEKKFIEELFKKDIHSALAPVLHLDLNERERDVIERRFRLNGGEKRETLRQIAEYFAQQGTPISPETVRKAENKAKKKIGDNEGVRQTLIDYMNA
jgi:RNA polymerase sigma factor (sigma-70 family)